MTTDIFLTILNLVSVVLLTGIGVEMVNNPPGEDPRKKRFYRILFCVLGAAVIASTGLQAYRTAKEQREEHTKHDTEQGRLEGKLSLLSDVMKQSSCPSTADIGAVVQQELASQRYQRARTPIAEGKLGSLSSDSLLQIVPHITSLLWDSKDRWQSADHNWELLSYADKEKEGWSKDNPRWQPSRTQQEWQAERRKLDNAYRTQLVQLLSDADGLRVALKAKLPKEAQTSEDDAEGAIFAQAKADAASTSSGYECCSVSIKNVPDYLDSLAKRVSRIKTLQN